jgi:hypothetical protein
MNRRSFLSRGAAATSIFMGTGFKSVLAKAAKVCRDRRRQDPRKS